MPDWMYEASVPVFTRAFGNMSALLDKVAAHEFERGLTPGQLARARLAPDMYDLSGQVQRASDAAKACCARLSRLQVPSFVDDERTISHLQVRIADTVAFIGSIPVSSFNGSADRTVTINLPGQSLELEGRDMLFAFSLPNFFFHATTVYAIARHNGVTIGKMDFLGDLARR